MPRAMRRMVARATERHDLMQIALLLPQMRVAAMVHIEPAAAPTRLTAIPCPRQDLRPYPLPVRRAQIGGVGQGT
jgi:hypothetical protein